MYNKIRQATYWSLMMILVIEGWLHGMSVGMVASADGKVVGPHEGYGLRCATVQPTASFRGMQVRGERIAILLDCSESMLGQNMGGLIGFQKIKDECVQTVERLQPGVLFNVYLFSNWPVNRFRPHMVVATPSAIQELREWFAPVNRTANERGIKDNNFNPDREYFHARQSGINSPRALHAAMEDGAEAIIVITAGFPHLQVHREDMSWNEQRMVSREDEKRKKDYERAMERWKGSSHEREYQEWHEVHMAAVYRKAEEILDTELAGLRAKGYPYMYRNRRSAMLSVIKRYDLKPEKPKPMGPPVFIPYSSFYTPERLAERLREGSFTDLYRCQNKMEPSIHIVLCGEDEQAAQNWRQFVANLQRGQFMRFGLWWMDE